MTIYVYEGATANRAEKRKGAQVAKHIKDDERAGKAKVHRVSEDEEAAAAFWAVLGGEPASIPEGGDDNAVPAPPATRIRAVGADADEDISGGLKRDVLTTDKVFLLSSDGSAFIWVGKGAPIEDKKGAMSAMDVFLADPATNTPKAGVSRVSEGVESGAFKAQFLQWRDPMKKLWGEKKASKPVTHEEVDFDKLLTNSANEDLGPDGGDGCVKVWRVQNMAKVEVPEAKHGQFFGGDSFVVLYTYNNKRGRESYIIYFWQGLETSTDEKGLSAIFANEMDAELGGSPVQVRVTQGQEPAHFRSLFKGKMIVHKGGVPSGFANVDEEDTTDQDGTALFQVRGTTPLNASAAQVEECATSLNSGDCFVLVCPSNVMVWNGSGATDGEKETAANIGTILAGDFLGVGGRALSTLEEGSESENFWSTLFGGKQVCDDMSCDYVCILCLPPSYHHTHHSPLNTHHSPLTTLRSMPKRASEVTSRGIPGSSTCPQRQAVSVRRRFWDSPRAASCPRMSCCSTRTPRCSCGSARAPTRRRRRRAPSLPPTTSPLLLCAMGVMPTRAL